MPRAARNALMCDALKRDTDEINVKDYTKSQIMREAALDYILRKKDIIWFQILVQKRVFFYKRIIVNNHH